MPTLHSDGSVLVLVARDSDNPRQAGGDRHIGVLAEELAARGRTVRLLCASDPSLPAHSERRGVRVDRIASLRWLGPAIWVHLLGGAGRHRAFVVEEMIGGARVPFLAPLFTRSPVVGVWYQDNAPLFRAQYGAVGARLAGAVQRFVLAVHRKCLVICPSEASRAWLVLQGYDPAKVGVYYPSVDPLGLADPSREFSQRRNLIVTVGNLRPFKRFEEAIRVLGRVRASVPDAELAIVGRRDDPAYLRRLVARSEEPDVRGSVGFHLDVSEPEKYRLFGEAKVLTVHSPVEGFGMTVAEAGLCGVPCAVNPGVSSEVVEAGVGGVRVPDGDVEAYARETVRLLRDAGEWTRLSGGARQGALRFAKPRIDPALERLLDRL